MLDKAKRLFQNQNNSARPILGYLKLCCTFWMLIKYAQEAQWKNLVSRTRGPGRTVEGNPRTQRGPPWTGLRHSSLFSSTPWAVTWAASTVEIKKLHYLPSTSFQCDYGFSSTCQVGVINPIWQIRMLRAKALSAKSMCFPGYCPASPPVSL